MCGIVAYIGTREVSPVLLDGLRRLEYRGYDSAGIAGMHAFLEDLDGEIADDRAAKRRRHPELFVVAAAAVEADDQPRRAVHRLGDRRQIEVIVAARSDRGADENRIDEQRRCDFLQPQPRIAEGSRDDVGGDRSGQEKASIPDLLLRGFLLS